MDVEEKPPSLQNSKRNRSPLRGSRISLCDYNRIPIWRGGNLAGLAIHGITCCDSLHQHKVVDMGARKDDQEMRWYRPNITVFLTLAVTVGFFLGKIDAQAFFGFATGLIVWWLKARDEEKRNGGQY